MTPQLEIDLESFAALQHEAFLIDVRTIYVICASGGRSLRAASALVASGLDALSVAGGTNGWAESGRPVVAGAPAP
jgi:rhodanese-related sulfurtransferase